MRRRAQTASLPADVRRIARSIVEEGLPGRGTDEHESGMRIRVAAPLHPEADRTWQPPIPSITRYLTSLAEEWRVRYSLTDKEADVFCAFLSSMPRTLIAERLKIEVATVTRHGRNICAKTGDARPTDAAMRALREFGARESTGCST